MVERKAAHPELPRFAVVPAAAIAKWKLSGTTVVEGTINGASMGRRTIKPWDERRWFIQLPEPLCRKARIDTGDLFELEIQIAPEEVPAELSRLLVGNRMAKATWDRLTSSQQRMLREEVAAAKNAATRERRAARSLLGRS